MAHIHDNPMRQKLPLPGTHSSMEDSLPSTTAMSSGSEIKQPADPDNDGICDGDFNA